MYKSHTLVILGFLLGFLSSAQAIERTVYEEAFTPAIVAQMEGSREFAQMMNALSGLFGKELTAASLYEPIPERGTSDLILRSWLESLRPSGRGPNPQLLKDALIALADALRRKLRLEVFPSDGLHYGDSTPVSTAGAAFLDVLPKGREVRLLNLGAGHGFLEMTVFARRDWEAIKVDSVEFFPKLVALFNHTKRYMAELDSARAGDFLFVEGDILLGLPAPLHDRKYDAVTAFNVIHFFHPRAWGGFFKTVADSLKVGGSFFLSTRDIQKAPVKEMIRAYQAQADADSPFLGFLKTTWTGTPGSFRAVGLSEEEPLLIGTIQTRSEEGVLHHTIIVGAFEKTGFCRRVGALTRGTFAIEECQSDGGTVHMVLRKIAD